MARITQLSQHLIAEPDNVAAVPTVTPVIF